MDLAAGLREEEGWRAELALREASLVQDGATLFSLGELRLSDVRLGDTLELGELALVRPFATSELDAEGVASIAGWRLVGAPVEASAPDGDVRDTRAPPALPELARLLVHKLAIEEGRIAWRTPSLAAELLLDLEGSELGTLARWDWRAVAKALEIPAEKRGRMLVLQDAVKRLAEIGLQRP